MTDDRADMTDQPGGGLDRQMPSGFQAWESRIHAFIEICAARDRPPNRPPAELEGISVAVKDIIDVAGCPTRNGSAVYREAAPARADAAVVAALRSAGATILGKATTTEFAFTDPTDCRNPYDLNRSPGGSSSGSGAAVAARLVDVALGTQTAGSLCRPAAYCGIVGFKPSYGVIPTQGVTPLAPSFDTVGIMARSVGMARRVFGAVAGDQATSDGVHVGRCRAVAGLFAAESDVAPEMLAAFHAAGVELDTLCSSFARTALEIDLAGVVADHRTVMTHEAAMAHGHLLGLPNADLLRPNFRAGLRDGAGVSKPDAETAKARLARARDGFWERMSDVDVILTLPVPDGAPLIDGTTGFQHWLTPWTVFGGPLVSLPWGLDALGRPRAVMLAGHPGRDAHVLAVAEELERQAPHMPPPSLPD